VGFWIEQQREHCEPMTETMLLDPVQVLVASDQPLQVGSAALFEDGRLIALGDEAREQASEIGIAGQNRGHQLLAPCLVDPHSSLPHPFTGSGETLETLINAAGRAGYGQLALLPDGESERDSPDRLKGFQPKDCDLKVHLWGSFSQRGAGERLSSHADLLQAGAIGLSSGEQMPSANLIDRALMLGEMAGAPVLIAPHDSSLRGDGMIREGVETLRAGWPADPTISETLPMGQLLELQRRHGNRKLVLMNLSTAEGVGDAEPHNITALATVSWWHLVQDRSKQTGRSNPLVCHPFHWWTSRSPSLNSGLGRGNDQRRFCPWHSSGR
jgi:dihydroorotase